MPAILLLVALLVGCQPRPDTVPQWYAQQSLQQQGVWIGYGDAPELQQAK